MSKVRHHSRRLPHGIRSPGGAAPKVPVDTADQENQWRRKCDFNHKGRQIKESSDRPKEHQRERVLLPPTGESSKEGINIDGSTNLRDRGITPTGQGGPRSLPDDQVEHRKTIGGTHQFGQVLVGKQHPVRFTRGYGSFRLGPFVSRPLQCFNCQKFGHQARTCRSKVQTCRYCAGRHGSVQCKDNETCTLKCVNCRHQSPLPKETGSRKQSETST